MFHIEIVPSQQQYYSLVPVSQQVVSTAWPASVTRALHRQVFRTGSYFIPRAVLVDEELDTIMKETGSCTIHKESVLSTTLRTLRKAGKIRTDYQMKTIEVLPVAFA